MKQPQRSALVLLCLLAILVSACAPATPAARTASPLTGALGELSGRVEARFTGEPEFHPAAAGDILQVKDQVQTGEDGRARVDLSSGTIIRVAPSSLFTLASNEPAQGGLATKLKLEFGRIYIILNGGSLDVETPSGVASVRGSYMMAEIDPVTLNVTVTCLEGHCSAGGIEFTDGQKVTLFYYDPATGQYRPPLLEDMNEEDFQKWLDDNPEAKQILDLVLAARARLAAAPTEEPAPTPDPAAGVPPPGAACFGLLEPPGGASLSGGLVTFAWKSQPGAAKYRIVFTSPSGAINILETGNTSLTNYIEILPSGGVYSWEVTALDDSGAPICTASALTFSKPETSTQAPSKGKEKLSCESGQWEYPSLPCYCDPYSYENPPYCGYGQGY